MRVQIRLDADEIVNSVQPRDIVKAYGLSEILSEVSLRDIVALYDKDELLDAIGEDAVRDWMNPVRIA